MNKLIIPNGGMPLHGNDFEWIHSGIFEAFKGVLSLYGANTSGNIILSGINVTTSGSSISISEGFVAINWEICYVPAATISNPDSLPYSVKLTQTYDPAGNELFADAVARDTYAIRRGVLSTGTTSNEIRLDTPNYIRLDARLAEVIISQFLSQQITTFTANFAADTTNPIYVKKFLKTVHLEGWLRRPGGNSNDEGDFKAFDLPAAYRPPYNRFFITTSAQFNFFRVIVYANGEVYVGNYGPSAEWIDGVHLTFSWSV